MNSSGLAEAQAESPAAPLAPPGKLVDVGGWRLHLHCMGETNGQTVDQTVTVLLKQALNPPKGPQYKNGLLIAPTVPGVITTPEMVQQILEDELIEEHLNATDSSPGR